MLLDKEDIPKDELKSYLSIISNLRANVDVNEDLYPLYDNKGDNYLGNKSNGEIETINKYSKQKISSSIT